jgi:CheY-like chemotaxis protein
VNTFQLHSSHRTGLDSVAGTALKPRILIVEDESIIAMDIAMQLRELGYEPLGPANTGEQAIEMAKRLHPQLVLMDVHLATQMDGITAAQEIRTQFDIPCVFMSAFTGEDIRARAMQTDPAGYVAKPFTELDLRTVMAAALP